MGVWNKVVTAFRGGVNEVGESIADGQAIRILEQEIRDADNQLRSSKDELAKMMAKHKLADNKVSSIEAKVLEYENYALQALENGDEGLAAEIAERIGNFEDELHSERELANGFRDTVSNLRKAVSQAEGNLRRLKQQVDSVKATESVQKAQAAVAHRHSGANSKMQTAMESLQRIKQKQLERKAQMDAAEQLADTSGDASLEAKLKSAGIKQGSSDAQLVLARLKQRQNTQGALTHADYPALTKES